MITYSLITKNGSRSINEDSVGVLEKDGNFCFVLCDGLGGHGMGDTASALVKDEFLTAFSEEKNLGVSFIKNEFVVAQEKLLKKQNELAAKNKMKTTAVCLVCDNKKGYVGYIGDSRFYAFSKNSVKLQSKDHSVPYMLYLSKEIKENEIRNHPDRNMLLRVMGSEWKGTMYEVFKPLNLKQFQAFLLCSDGFWELITENEMCELLKKTSTVEEWLDAMAKVVQKNGIDKEMDNYSAIAILNK
jgi:serine/threonine protein phosphatase PrpC